MKKLVLIGFIFLSSCKGTEWGLYDRNNYVKRSYWTKAQILEYQTMNPAVHTAVDLKLSDEFLNELRENLIKTGVIIQDTIKIKSNGDKKFNQGYSSSRGIIL